jgi:hypothetical protein
MRFILINLKNFILKYYIILLYFILFNKLNILNNFKNKFFYI